ncbi:hypothetical protein [Haladaptatus salinisoli]|uniref:hypothetical protein n=1 Tax=Haladaptatus salinisoli TaxID=2884876 RepID=UPI001D0AA191|nr:hypothetical protein [Haladaptatus salinisoli]
MPTNERGRASPNRHPRIAPPRRRIDRNRLRTVAELRAELDSLRRHLAETEVRLASLERECRRRERLVRACSMCGRVSTRPGPDAECPHCEDGRLRRI